MKTSTGWAGAVLAVAMLIAGPPALAQEPAQTKENWQCKINIQVPGIDLTVIKTPEGVDKQTVFYTTKTRKQCPGNTSTTGGTAQLTIDCETQAPVPYWTGGAQSTSGFPCKVYRKPCGLDGLLETDDTSLQINGQGIAKLRCTCAAIETSPGVFACG